MSRPSLTRVAQQRLAEVLHDGDLVVDATVGNGHDTLFLADRVGPHGHVWGFDVQPAALAGARTRLADKDLLARVTLVHRSHATLDQTLPGTARGRLAAVMFNLGYLPGGDKALTTTPDTTLRALAASVANLRPGGWLSVLAYRGHPGGQAEADAVARWLEDHNGSGLSVEIVESPGPVLYLARRS